MIYLLGSIISSAILVLLFKVFEQRGIPIFQAIVFNYITATLCGIIFLPDKTPLITGTIFSHAWLPFALLLGTMFITVFNLTSMATVRYGVSTASLAMKLGLVFPVMLAFFLYGESFNYIKLFGILFAFAAVILSSLKDETQTANHKSAFAVLPIFVFIGSGACDSFTQFVSKKYVGADGMEEFSLFLFLAAAIVGTSLLGFQLITKKASFNKQSLIYGAILGTINYFSFLFILKALSTISWGSSVVFPINNLGIVLFATLAGVILFEERISKVNLLGLAFAVLSITLIILSNIS